MCIQTGGIPEIFFWKNLILKKISSRQKKKNQGKFPHMQGVNEESVWHS